MTLKLKNKLKYLIVIGALGTIAGSIPLTLMLVNKQSQGPKDAKTVNITIDTKLLQSELIALESQLKFETNNYSPEIESYKQNISENDTKINQNKEILATINTKRDLLIKHDQLIESINNNINSLIEIINNDLYRQNLVKYLYDTQNTNESNEKLYELVKNAANNWNAFLTSIKEKNNSLNELIANNKDKFINSDHNLAIQQENMNLLTSMNEAIGAIKNDKYTIVATKDFLDFYDKFLISIKNYQIIEEFNPELLTLESNIAEKSVDNATIENKLINQTISLYQILVNYNNVINSFLSENIEKVNNAIVNNLEKTQINKIYTEALQNLKTYQNQIVSDYKKVINALKLTFSNDQDLISNVDKFEIEFEQLINKLDKTLKDAQIEKQLRISSQNIQEITKFISTSFSDLLKELPQKISGEFQNLENIHSNLKEDYLNLQKKLVHIQNLENEHKILKTKLTNLELEFKNFNDESDVNKVISDANLKNLNEKIQNRKTQLQDLENQILQNKEDVNSLKTNIQASTSEINTTINENNKLVVSHTYFQNVLNSKLSQIDNLTNEIKILALKNEFNQNKNIELQNLLQKRDEDIKDLKKQAQDLKNDILLKLNDIDVLNKEIVRLNIELNNAQNDNLALQRSINEKNNQVLNLENQVLLLQNQINEINIVLAQRDEWIKQLEKENSNLQNELNAQRNNNSELSNQNNTLVNENNSLTAQIANKNNIITELNTQKAELDSNLASQREKNAQLQTQNNHLNNELNTQMATNAQLSTHNDDLTSENNALKAQISDKNTLIAQLRNENQDLTKRILHQNQVINNLNQQNQNNNNRIDELTQELDREISKNNELIAENLNKISALNQANNMIKNLQSQIEILKNNIRNLDYENSTLKSKISNTLSKLNKILEQLNSYTPTKTHQANTTSTYTYTRYEYRINYEYSYNNLETLRTTVIAAINEIINLLK